VGGDSVFSICVEFLVTLILAVCLSI